MNEEANYVLRKAGYDINPWDGFVQRGSTAGGISKEIRTDKLKDELSTLSREDLNGLGMGEYDSSTAKGFYCQLDRT